ncbi:MAG TPA: PEP-CTERM sorting domain-containing protein [Oculatellaceae cyanobacterium]|jgi:hypothetical protein
MTLNLITKLAVAGATLLAAAGVNQQSAHAVLLNFDFALNNGGTGSIVLNSDVVDTNQDFNTNPPTSLLPEQVPFVSSFPGAVVAAQYTDATGNVVRNSQPTDLIAFSTGQGTLQYLSYGDQFGVILNFAPGDDTTTSTLINNISSDPALYQASFVLNPPPPAPGQPTNRNSGIDQYGEDILDANATGGFTATAAVPEPSSSAGVVVLGAMGVGSLLKRKRKKVVA